MIFTYKEKRDDFLTDFLFLAQKFTFVVGGIIPTIKELESEDGYQEGKIKDSYNNFEKNKYLWNEMAKTKRKLYFTKKDKNIKKLVDEIYEFYKELMPTIISNYYCYTNNYNNPGAIDTVIGSMEKLFDITYSDTQVPCATDPKRKIPKKLISYKSKAYNQIIPKLNELEKILYGESTIKMPLFPIALFTSDD
jgi:hypothetical protein